MNSEEQSSTEKFTGTMPVQDKLRFPEKELEAYLNDTLQYYSQLFYYNLLINYYNLLITNNNLLIIYYNLLIIKNKF